MSKDVEENDIVPTSDPVDSRWERPAPARATARRTATRRKVAKDEESQDVTGAGEKSVEAAQSKTKTTAARKTRVAPVPRDVPCEWVPGEGAPVGESPEKETKPRAGRASARSSEATETQAGPEQAKPAAPDRTRVASAEGKSAHEGNNERSSEPGAANQREAEQGQGEHERRDDRHGHRNERFHRSNRNQQRGGREGADARHQGSGEQGGGQQRNQSYRQRNQQGGQQRNEYRRLSRHELRRMNRRERMLLRKQDDPFDPNASLEAVMRSEASTPDAPPPLRMSDLQKMDVQTLFAQAEKLGIVEDLESLGKHDIIYELLRHHAQRGGHVVGEGVLEMMSDGFGFLRNPYNHYHTCPEDACVLPAMVRRFRLRPGDTVVGLVRPPLDAKNRYFTLVNIETINDLSPEAARRITPFVNLTPTFPDRRINLEVEKDEVSMRVTNIFTPVGFGQRGLIVAPPRTGKTVLLQQMANSISANHPDAHLIILLIDERPEEVTDMQRNTKAQVFSSTFDEPPDRHVQVADIVIEKARRLVELGKDVVILLDSITRLARAYNTVQPNSGKILSGGVDSNALQKPKRFFGAARNIEGGGSLTIIATALIDTGSRMDEVIFEEFKGTGNMELCLDRALVDKRVFPAINIEKSGTRKEELLLHSEELARTWVLRRAINGVPPVEAMEMIIKRLKSTGTNAEFLMSMKE